MGHEQMQDAPSFIEALTDEFKKLGYVAELDYPGCINIVHRGALFVVGDANMNWAADYYADAATAHMGTPPSEYLDTDYRVAASYSFSPADVAQSLHAKINVLLDARDDEKELTPLDALDDALKANTRIADFLAVSIKDNGGNAALLCADIRASIAALRGEFAVPVVHAGPAEKPAPAPETITVLRADLEAVRDLLRKAGENRDDELVEDAEDLLVAILARASGLLAR